MKIVIGAAVIVAALVPWQLSANATMITTNLEGQPLTRAACDTAGLVWNDSRNVCDWQPTQELSELITGAIAPSQPLTRAACDTAGLVWNDSRNVCDWQATQELSELITGAIAPSQPLTRAACDKAGLAWNDSRNVCDWQPTQELSELITGAIAPSQPLTRAACDTAGLAWNDSRNVCNSAETLSSEIASKPQRATKQSTQINTYTKRKYAHTRQTQVAKSRPFPLFRLFRD